MDKNNYCKWELSKSVVRLSCKRIITKEEAKTHVNHSFCPYCGYAIKVAPYGQK